MVSLNSQRVMTLAMENPINQLLLERLATLNLPNCMLTAGCLFQAGWNKHCGQPAGWGVKDYDVIITTMTCLGRPKTESSNMFAERAPR